MNRFDWQAPQGIWLSISGIQQATHNPTRHYYFIVFHNMQESFFKESRHFQLLPIK